MRKSKSTALGRVIKIGTYGFWASGPVLEQKIAIEDVLLYDKHILPKTSSDNKSGYNAYTMQRYP